MMVDTALLTEKGIVFCLLPGETILRVQGMLRQAKPGSCVVITVDLNGKEYEVEGRNLLVKYEVR